MYFNFIYFSISEHELISLPNALRIFLEIYPWFHFHLNDGYLIIFLQIIHYCIDLRNSMTYIPNCLCLMHTVGVRSFIILLCHSDTKANPSCNDLYHMFNTAMVLYYFFFSSAPYAETHILSCIKILIRSQIFLVTFILIS